jgi:hypothetical protein
MSQKTIEFYFVARDKTFNFDLLPRSALNTEVIVYAKPPGVMQM